MRRLDHVNIHTRDAATMIRFLTDVLEVKEGGRPPFPNPGHWLYIGDQAVIHLDVIERETDFPTGIYNHVAFALYDFEPALKRVEASGFRHEYRDIPGTKLGQIFVYGPEGVKIELQYPRTPRSR
ncbi:MAG: glyoxalase [Devosia sp.]|uniref:VOC family protein n=1 Tax=Devosia sp. TaxID=1871048 RepID=UPI001A541EE2|nr:VOC family protein [Devosia sp.]MBL8600035.1 glyoxalase [Devosia sp.]